MNHDVLFKESLESLTSPPELPVPTLLPLPTLLKVLADPTRLRILALLEGEELTVGELARALGLAQSRVSNHLRVLREAGLLVERHVGVKTHLRSALGGGAGVAHPSPAVRVWRSLRPGLEDLPEQRADRLRLSDLLAERRAASRDFFDHLAGEWDKVGTLFETGAARERAAASLLPPGLVLADLGCGTGYLARALLGLAGRIVCVDRSPGMLAAARERLESASAGTTIEYRLGELDALPIADDELDGALAGMVLHHLEELDGTCAEMRRAIRPGGTAVVLELAPHRETWMQRALGDRHLGLEAADVAAALERAGLQDVRIEDAPDRYCPQPEEKRAEGSENRAEGDGPGEGHGAGAKPVALSLYIVRGRVPSARPDRPS